jgi:hypothetical protein
MAVNHTTLATAISGQSIDTVLLSTGIHIPTSILRGIKSDDTPVDLRASSAGELNVVDASVVAAITALATGLETVSIANFPATQPVSGTVAVSNPTANPETGLAKDATLTARLPSAVAGRLPVDARSGSVWWDEGTTNPTGSPATFTGASRDIFGAASGAGGAGYTRFGGQSITNQPGKLFVDVSKDGTTWQRVYGQATYQVTTGGSYVASIDEATFARFARIAFVADSTAPTSSQFYSRALA